MRKTLHLFMALALVACLVSLIDSSFARSRPCPLCNGPAEFNGRIRSLLIDGKSIGSVHEIYRCSACDYEVCELTETRSREF